MIVYTIIPIPAVHYPYILGEDCQDWSNKSKVFSDKLQENFDEFDSNGEHANQLPIFAILLYAITIRSARKCANDSRSSFALAISSASI